MPVNARMATGVARAIHQDAEAPGQADAARAHQHGQTQAAWGAPASADQGNATNGSTKNARFSGHDDSATGTPRLVGVSGEASPRGTETGVHPTGGQVLPVHDADREAGALHPARQLDPVVERRQNRPVSVRGEIGLSADEHELAGGRREARQAGPPDERHGEIGHQEQVHERRQERLAGGRDELPGKGGQEIHPPRPRRRQGARDCLGDSLISVHEEEPVYGMPAPVPAGPGLARPSRGQGPAHDHAQRGQLGREAREDGAGAVRRPVIQRHHLHGPAALGARGAHRGLDAARLVAGRDQEGQARPPGRGPA
jgi:hypothetical protein